MRKELIKSILVAPASFETFQNAFDHKKEYTAGGMQGLTYAMMKAWPPEITRYVYGLLCSLWADKMVPRWWRHRRLIPLRKKPENPTLDELRPIVLLEVTRKC